MTFFSFFETLPFDMMYTVVQWSRSSSAVESLSLMRILSSATHTRALERGINLRLLAYIELIVFYMGGSNVRFISVID